MEQETEGRGLYFLIETPAGYFVTIGPIEDPDKAIGWGEMILRDENDITPQ